MTDNSKIKVILLGLAQDAGVPQSGCDCRNCQTLNSKDGWPVSLALVDDEVQKYWIIDATPKFPEQYNWIRQKYPKHEFCGILLSHAHIGHYTGLMYLGREAMNTKSFPIYASTSMQQFLSKNAPWSQLIDLENIKFIDLNSEQQISLSTNITIKPIAVTHRSEFSDTLAFLIQGSQNNLFYCPDIDHWHGLDLNSYLDQGDYALLDGTFFSESELPGRNIKEIPHPLVTQTVEFVKDQSFKTWILHLNHSNPLWRSEQEKTWIHNQGIKLVNFGCAWEL